MNLQELQEYLNQLIDSLRHEEQSLLRARLKGLVSAFPFNEYEYMITFLVDRGVISFTEYEKLREDYVAANRYLSLYEIAPRIFGQVWGERHLMDIEPRFRKPSKDLDPAYEGQYDLWFDGVRVEVKAARAIDTKKRGSQVSRALHRRSNAPFWMNFQQIKLGVCHVFVFIGVWVDEIIYWVLSDDEVAHNRYLSHQHRGGIEYQIGITQENIAEFETYRVDASEIANAVICKSRKNNV